jgi:2'-5' RNA ligase
MRTFIAIDLLPEIKDRLIDFIGRLRKAGGSVKWVKPQALHLTIKFLGEIPEDKVPLVESVIRSVCAGRRPFPLVVEGTGSFPAGRNPRVLWTGIREETELASLQADLEEALDKEGFSREERDFHPHLTLGRVKAPQNLKETMEILGRHGQTHFGEMVVNELTFFQSILKPEGPEYRVLSRVEMK